MMANQRGLGRLNARRGYHALLTRNQPGIKQQEIDRPTTLYEHGKGGLDAGRRVEIQLQRRERRPCSS